MSRRSLLSKGLAILIDPKRRESQNVNASIQQVDDLLLDLQGQDSQITITLHTGANPRIFSSICSQSLSSKQYNLSK